MLAFLIFNYCFMWMIVLAACVSGAWLGGMGRRDNTVPEEGIRLPATGLLMVMSHRVAIGKTKLASGSNPVLLTTELSLPTSLANCCLLLFGGLFVSQGFPV